MTVKYKYDLPKLETPREDHYRIPGTVVIVGGRSVELLLQFRLCMSLTSQSLISMAGLWTARVCADHFEDVLIVEPEAWTTKEEGSCSIFDENGDLKDGVSNIIRQRVPQYLTVHRENDHVYIPQIHP